MNIKLLDKYNVPVPRYTSYPTVPFWKEGIDVNNWKNVFSRDFDEANKGAGISLYIHLPFCESLCTYCGCNKKITTNHGVEEDYIAAIHREWKSYRELMDAKPVIRELHLGGGTPTFFTPANLQRLLSPILSDAIIPHDHDFSFEGHPNNTTTHHLQALYDLGFRRVSYGVQDNNSAIQRLINRLQPFENVQRATETARNMGYRSVNFDLIYGLPQQTVESIQQTIQETTSLLPDRIAFYSYAHVPWTSRGQRLFDETDLPSAQEKMAMYLASRTLFLQKGYRDVGMDHFSLPTDDLYSAQQRGALHRNFMGYTTQQTRVLLGLGVSAISSTPGAFAQNEKALHTYYASVAEGQLPIAKGIFVTNEDQRFAAYIREIICNGKTTIHTQDAALAAELVAPRLTPLQDDGLIDIQGNTIIVTPPGRNFLRNICSAFDLHLIRSKIESGRKVFSNAV